MGPGDDAAERAREGGAASTPAPLVRPPASGGAIWLAVGALAVGGVLIAASLTLQNGKPRSASPDLGRAPSDANTMFGSPTNAATPGDSTASPRDPVLALTGFWGLNDDCTRPTSLTVMSGQLFAAAPNGSIEIGKIQSDDPATGKVVVRQPPGDATTYQVLGDTLLVSSGERAALIFMRCRGKPGASTAAPSPRDTGDNPS